MLINTGTCYFLRNCYISQVLCLGGLKKFGEKNPEKMYNVYWH